MKKNVTKKHKINNKNKKIVRKVIKVKAKSKPKVQVKAKSKGQIKPIAKIKAKKVIKVKKPEKKIAPKKLPVSRVKSAFGPVNVKPYQTKKNEEYMSKKQLGHFREVLLEWKSELMAEVDRTVHHMKEEVANYPDPVDRASQEEEFNLELRARDRERKLLRKIEETLNRINDNDYGYCDDCGAEIGIRRLEARPTATQCIECKTISEIREKQVGDGNIFE